MAKTTIPHKNSQSNEDYKARITKVFEFIEANLDQGLSLNRLAEVASFSPYHFHRIFKYITAETLNSYVNRKRIERSASDLLHKTNSISELAHRYGFSDISSFSKSFKKYFKLSPTDFLKHNPLKHSKIEQILSKNGQAYPDIEQYLCLIDKLKNWIDMNSKIAVKEIAQMDLAYISCMGPENMPAAYGQLVQWAGPKDLINEDTKMVTVYHDSFKVTSPEKVRMSASILLDRPVEAAGSVALRTINAGKCIIARFEIGMDQFEKSWTGLFLWMNENGYQKADSEPFEIYHNNMHEHPEKLAIVDFCIPVKA